MKSVTRDVLLLKEIEKILRGLDVSFLKKVERILRTLVVLSWNSKSVFESSGSYFKNRKEFGVSFLKKVERIFRIIRSVFGI